MPIVKLQFNEQGMHRIQVDGVAGEWAMYEHVSEHAGYMGFTQFYGDKERVVKVEDIEVVLESICNTCGAPTGFNGKTLPQSTCEHQKARYPDLLEPKDC